MNILPGLRLASLCFASSVALFGAEPTVAPSPLLRAVRLGATAEWQTLLAAKADVHARDAAGNTALHFAALNHDFPAVNALLAASAEVDAKNTAAATPLIYGAGHAEIVRALLARGASPGSVSQENQTPLMAAAAGPDGFEAVRQLLAAGAELTPNRSASRRNASALNNAIAAGDHRTITLLLDRGAEVNPKVGFAPLAGAAFLGDVATVRMLLDRGADPGYNNGFAGHALNFALFAGQVDAARLLVERGASLQLRSPSGHGTPPMVFAAYNQDGDATVAKLLLDRGVDPNAANDAGATALTWALRTGAHTPLVETLRGAGAKAPESVRAKRLPDRPVPESPADRAALVRERIPATLHLLQRSSTAFLENAFVQKANCSSCHGQDLPAVVVELARARGFPVDDVGTGRRLAARYAMWKPVAEGARQMKSPLPDVAVSAGYGFFGLTAVRHPSDDMAEAIVRFLIRTQRPEGHWPGLDRRPPMEDGPVVATAWAALGVRDYPPVGIAREAAESQARSAAWLARREPANHNEAVFQLLGLHWSGVPADRVGTSVQRIVRSQRPDGGWAQLPALESDAWATGTALYALHEAGGMKTADAVYQRGVAFLLRTQFEDGSWWVKSRVWPFQPHFNGQFPHGKDQWMSQGATAWAAAALLFTIEPVKPALPAPTAQELIATYAGSPAAQRRKGAVATAAAPMAATANPAVATVDFARDIQPLFKRSCVGCHDGEKPRGGFALVSREAVLKGGASGDPAIAPGFADDSTMIQYVTGKIEDLEMPPLDRREKYPALSAAEIDLLRTWIDSGAPWAPVKTVSNEAR